MNIKVRELADPGTDTRRVFFERDAGAGEVQSDMRDIVERVRREGDVVVRESSNEFDGVQVGSINVISVAECAYDEIDDDVREAIEVAMANIRESHERQAPEDWYEELGNVDTRELGHRYRPFDRAGVHASGGTVAYPSSALMGATLTEVAGVEHVTAATPSAEPMNPATLAAIHIAGTDAVHSVDGAQGTAALACGTETVKAIQRVISPGNKWATTTKAEVRGGADIDFLAGPPEVFVVVNRTVEARSVIADLVVQVKHDPNTSVVTVTDDTGLVAKVVAKIERQAGECERVETIKAALESDVSGVLLAWSMSEAVPFVERYTAGYLTIQTDDDEASLNRIDSTGSVFLSPCMPVTAGDYASGMNYILPTGGGAKRQGGLSVDHFVRSTTVQRLDRNGLSEFSETVMTLAKAEGLDAHAQSVHEWFEE